MNCALCGLPTTHSDAFCCPGCKNVHAILIESGALKPGQDPRETELYRRSLRMGLVSQAATRERAAIPVDEEVRDAVYHVAGMWCASCGWLVEHALTSEPGVVSAEVMFASDLLKVKYCPRFVPPGRIEQRVGALGYRASEYTAQTECDHTERRDLLLRVGVAAFLWMNVMVLSLVIYASYWEAISETARRIVPAVLAALTAPAIFYSAWPILRAAALGLRAGVLRMESLLALGILAAYVYSAAQAFLGGKHYYFDTACAIITLVLLGKAMERAAKERTVQSIAVLYRMMPRKARMLIEGRESYTAIEALAPGMRFLVKPGERVPADGLVTEGASHVDESVVTGESAPRAKRVGDAVICGSLNTEGVLHVRATRVGAESTLNQIIRSVEAAMASRSRIERTVDRVSRAFVPAVVAIAALTLAGWLAAGAGASTALMRAIAVLVIACPCALGIATPLAITAAVGAASRRGILVSDARVLETVREINVVVLDKTGTMTEGDFSVLEVALAPVRVAAGHAPITVEDALSRVAALEAYSEHPLARAVLRYAGVSGAATAVEVRAGMGIAGTVDGAHVWTGNSAMMHGFGSPPDAGLESRVAEWQARGHTVAYFGWDGETAGAIAFGDRLRPDAAHCVAEFRRRGIRTALISGDARATTEWVARELGVDEFHAEVLPAGKLELLEAYKRPGAKVAMIGDGVNDAPALAAADLGIALGSGADIAMNAAPVVLMTRDLGRVIDVFALSRKTLTVVRQNLFWAFFYNTLGISLAIAGVLDPILAAGAMVLSSLSVIGNSRRV